MKKFFYLACFLILVEEYGIVLFKKKREAKEVNMIWITLSSCAKDLF